MFTKCVWSTMFDGGNFVRSATKTKEKTKRKQKDNEIKKTLCENKAIHLNDLQFSVLVLFSTLFLFPSFSIAGEISTELFYLHHSNRHFIRLQIWFFSDAHSHFSPFLFLFLFLSFQTLDNHFTAVMMIMKMEMETVMTTVLKLLPYSHSSIESSTQQRRAANKIQNVKGKNEWMNE